MLHSTGVTGPMFLLFDAAFVALVTVVLGTSAAAVAALVDVLPLPRVALAFLAPIFGLLFLCGVIAMLGLVRLCLPRLPEGRFRFPGDAGARAWVLHFALGRIAAWPIFSPFFFSFAFLRYLLLRALGARVPFVLHTSSDVGIIDAPLVELGRNTMLGGNVLLAGHMMQEEILVTGALRLGEEVQVGGGCRLVGPGRVGARTSLGPSCTIAPHVSIGADCHIGAGTMVASHVEIDHDVVIGNDVRVDSNVEIGAGAVIASGTRVGKGTKVAPGAHLPARAT